MQNTSDLYKNILDGPHHVETKLLISGVEYGSESMYSVKTITSAFGRNVGVGDCPCGEIQVQMRKPYIAIPRMAKLELFIRLSNDEEFSEWIPKGTFYLDRREDNNTAQYGGLATTSLYGYNSMIFSEGDCPSSGLTFPALDTDVVTRIANDIGVPVDPATIQKMTLGYRIPSVAYYSGREILGYIAAAYASSFIISDDNHLKMVQINGMPEETNYLVTSGAARFAITFGGDRIIVY